MQRLLQRAFSGLYLDIGDDRLDQLVGVGVSARRVECRAIG
jgi:hypothetical protein